jgi:hypothetical protein
VDNTVEILALTQWTLERLPRILEQRGRTAEIKLECGIIWLVDYHARDEGHIWIGYRIRVDPRPLEHWFTIRIPRAGSWEMYCLVILEQVMASFDANTPTYVHEIRTAGGDEHVWRATLHNGIVEFWLALSGWYVPGALLSA